MNTFRFAPLRSFAAVLLFAGGALIGCADTADRTDDDTNAESALEASRTISLLPHAKDYVDEYMKLFAIDFAAARASHPDIDELDGHTTNVFLQGHPALETPMEAFGAQRNAPRGIPIDNVLAEFRVWLARVVADAAGSDGRIADRGEFAAGMGNAYLWPAYFAAERIVWRTDLKSSPGIDVEQMMSDWAARRTSGGASFREPALLNGAPTPEKVQSALKIDRRSSKTGTEAVDVFVGIMQGIMQYDGRSPAPRTPNARRLADAWKSSSVRAQYFFENDGPNHAWWALAIVDEHGQVFGFRVDTE